MTSREFREQWCNQVQRGIDEHGYSQEEAERSANLALAWRAHAQYNALRPRVVANVYRSSISFGVVLGWVLHWLLTL